MNPAIRIFALTGFLALGAIAPISAAESLVLHQRLAAYSYQDGYNQGFSETMQNKCIDGSRFEANYSQYEERAQNNYDNSIGTPSEDYYRGYLDGLHDAYNQPAAC